MENKIKDLIVKSYMDAVTVAELNEVEIHDFKLWVSDCLLSLFLSINEVGMDQVDPQSRADVFAQSLQGFVDKARSLYAQHLAEEIEARKPRLRSVESDANFDRRK